MNWQQLLDFVTCPELFGTLKSPLKFLFYFLFKRRDIASGNNLRKKNSGKNESVLT